MALGGLTPGAHAVLARAVSDERVRARYWAKVAQPESTTCWFYIGSLHPKGHGRFWVGTHLSEHGPRDVCVIAHRFGWALAHGLDALDATPVLAHQCDEPSCQNPDHLLASTWSDNLSEWQRRRWTPSSPLRDTRGPGGRARAIREAILAGGDLAAVMKAGQGPLDRDQLELF